MSWFYGRVGKSGNGYSYVCGIPMLSLSFVFAIHQNISSISLGIRFFYWEPAFTLNLHRKGWWV